MANSYAANELKKEGVAVMAGCLLYDLVFECTSKKCLESAVHFKKFLLKLDQMLDDDMILEIKEVISNVLP